MLHKLMDAIRQGLAAHRIWAFHVDGHEPRSRPQGSAFYINGADWETDYEQPDTLAFDCTDNPVDEPQAPRSWW